MLKTDNLLEVVSRSKNVRKKGCGLKLDRHDSDIMSNQSSG